MVPSLLMVRVGERGRFSIPLPIFLLWPFLALGALLVGLAVLVTHRSSRAGRWARSGWLAMRLTTHLSGLRIDVAERDGERVHIQFI